MSLLHRSEMQREASRRNGRRSRGPVTAAGKARSSLNSLKHGRYAIVAAVLRGEDLQAHDIILADYVDRFAPQDAVEMSLVRQLVSIDWRLSRIVAIESRTLDREIDIQASTRAAGARPSPLDLVAQAQQSLVERSRLPQFLARRESQLIQARLATLRMLENCAELWPRRHRTTEPLEYQLVTPEPEPPNKPETTPQLFDSKAPGNVADLTSRADAERQWRGDPEPVSRTRRIRSHFTRTARQTSRIRRLRPRSRETRAFP